MSGARPERASPSATRPPSDAISRGPPVGACSKGCFVTRVTHEPSLPPHLRPRLNPSQMPIDHQMKDA
jgi:hypothetical protein